MSNFVIPTVPGGSVSGVVVERRSPHRLDATKFSSLAAALTHHAVTRPDADAIVTESAALTWRQLRAQLATLLPTINNYRATSCRPLAVDMDGSIESIVTAIAVLMSSVPLVPMDHYQPAPRRDLIMDLTKAERFDTTFGRRVPVTASSSEPCPADTRSLEPLSEPDPDEVAIILMTSGSSGIPKGVMLSHRMTLGKAYDVIGPLILNPDDRLANVLPIGFGAGMNTLVAGLLAGLPVVCRDPRATNPTILRGWLRDQRVTTLHCSASLGLALATAEVDDDETNELADVRIVVFYGEPLHGADLRVTRSGLAPTATVVNWYACTECGVVAFRSFPPDGDVADGRLAVGRAVRGRRIMIVDESGEPVTPGDVGEIWIKGGDFAVGYLGDQYLPITTTDDGENWYRTGDRGRVDADNAMHVVGRVGSAVKIRGYLVEPGEVETALRNVDGVAEAFVEGVDCQGRTELMAHVALDEPPSESAVGAQEIRTEVRRNLPDWMSPRFVEFYERLPRTDRGKVDRTDLRSLDRRAPGGSTRESRGFRTTDLTVLGVAEMVRTVMDLHDIGIDDDLVELGADSLALTTILARVTAHFHVHIDVARVAAHPSIATIAAIARDEVKADARSRQGMSVLVPLRKDGKRTPLFVVAGAGAPAVSLIPTARNLAPGRAVYGLQAWGLENRGRPDRTVAAAARRNIAAIRDVAPTGPYLLAGHSMGAHIAWEMAAQLRDAGESVDGVILIDPHLSQQMLTHLGGPGSASPDIDAAEPVDLHRGEALRIGIGRLIAVRLKMMVAGIVQFDPVTQWLLFYNLGMATLGRHRPRTLDVAAEILTTADNPHGRSNWSLMARGPLNLRPVPGGHTDLLRDPYVTTVVASIDASLDALTVE